MIRRKGDIKMSLIGKKLEAFKVDAYHDSQFIEVTHKELEGKWNVFMFYPADFSFVCPTELEDMANQDKNSIWF